MNAQKFLKNFNKENQNYYFIMFSILLISNIIVIFVPLLDKHLIDLSIKKQYNLSYYILIGMVLILSIFVVNFVKMYLKQKIGILVIKKMKNNVMRRILKMPYRHFQNYSNGYYLVVLNKDILAFVNNQFSIIVSYLEQLVMFLFSILIMSYFNFKLTLITLVIIPLSSIVIMSIQKKIHKKNELFMEAYSDLQNVEQDYIGGKLAVMLSRSNNFMMNIFDVKLSNYVRANISLNTYTILGTSIFQVLQRAIHVLIMIIGIYWIIQKKDLTLGSLIAFASYANYLINPVTSLSQIKIAKEIRDTHLRRIIDIFPKTEKMVKQSYIKNDKIFQENIRFSNLQIKYDSNIIIDNLNMELLGKKLNIIFGESGGGKTSIAKVLLGLESYNGKILFNKTELQDLKSCIMDNVRYSMPKPYLFNITVKDNIILGRDIDIQYFDYLIDMFKMKDWLEKPINSLSNISDGQKKIVEIIRCLVAKNGKIYIFDEPTANLDIVNRRKVINLLVDLSKSKTVIILTHDNDFKNVADKMINLNELKGGNNE